MTTEDPIGALRAAVESHERYAELTGRSLDCIVLHPEHARQILARVDALVGCPHQITIKYPSTGEIYCHDCQQTFKGELESHRRSSTMENS